MKAHRQYVAEQEEKDPTFAEEYAMARVEARFAMELARLREQRGLTQQTPAERAGLKQPMVARYEKGQIPKAETLLRLARALNARISFTGNDVHITAERPVQRRPRSAASA